MNLLVKMTMKHIKDTRPRLSQIFCKGSWMGLGTSRQPVDMSSPLVQFVQDTISKDKIVIFSKTYCPYCKMAKDVFTKMQKPFTVIELDGRDDADTIQGILGELTGARTVPRVFVNGECVGGGSDVKAMYENGKLEEMLSITN